MATIPVGVRLDEDLVKRIDEIAEKTCVSRTDVIERSIRLGIVREEELANAAPWMLACANVVVSEPFVRIFTTLAGKAPNPKQVERLKRMAAKRRAEKAGRAKATEAEPAR